MSKQESVSDWMELAKAFDKAEKETVEHYFIVRIEDRTTGELLYKYDVPRALFWKYTWVFRWRKSRFHCQRPKNDIIQTITPYDKKTGLEMGLNSLLSKYTSAKAQITMVENKMTDYVERMKGDLFFDEKTDPIISKLRCKLESYKAKKIDYEREIKEKVAEKQKLHS